MGFRVWGLKGFRVEGFGFRGIGFAGPCYVSEGLGFGFLGDLGLGSFRV